MPTLILRIFIVLGLLFSSCTRTIKTGALDQDLELSSLLQKWQEAHGGLSNWNNIQNLEFRKRFALLDSLGSVEKEFDQHQSFRNKENPKVVISYSENGNEIELVSHLNTFRKYKNKVEDRSADTVAVRNSLLASSFVTGLPFSINQKNAQVEYVGIDTFNGYDVQVIRCSYDKSELGEYKSQDIWWHFIDQENHLSRGYMVKHADHHSLIYNDTYRQVGNFKLIYKRSSYRCNPDRSIKYLRASYIYDDYGLAM